VKRTSIVTGASLAIAALSISWASSQYSPQVEVGKDAVKIEWYQPASGIGKLLSFMLICGGSYFVWDGLKPGKTALAKSVSPIVRERNEMPMFISQPTHEAIDSTEYTADELIDFADEPIDESALSYQSDTPVPKAEPVSIFERIRTNKKRQLFVPTTTGGGKTTLLLSAIEHINNVTGGNAEFYGSTAKPSPWGGLEDLIAGDGQSHVIELSITNPASLRPLIKRIDWLRQRLEARQKQRSLAQRTGETYNPKPVYIIFDEWLRTLKVAEVFDRQNETKYRQILIDFVEDMAIAGREDEFGIWLFAQDSQVQNAGINTGYKNNFGFLVLGSLGNMECLEKAILSKNSIVESDRLTKQKLWEQAQRLAEANPDVAIAYSNLYGHEILVTPYLPDIKRKRIFGSPGTVEDTPSKENKILQFPQPQKDLETDIWSEASDG
jgi:hypothetical protein